MSKARRHKRAKHSNTAPVATSKAPASSGSPSDQRERSRAPALIGSIVNAWREWPVLAGLLLAAGAFWVFIGIADEVREGSTAGVDKAILLWFRTPADLSQLAGPPWLHEMMRDFTGIGGVGVLTLVTAGVAGFLALDGKLRQSGLLLSAVLGGLLLSTMLKHGFARPRPDIVPHASIVNSPSFPSGHSMLSAIVYLTLGAMIARLRAERRLKAYVLLASVLLTVLVGVSRVYLGVHWPTDVLAGWVVGSGWALFCWYSTLRLQAQGRLPSD